MEQKTINYGDAIADYITDKDYGTIIHYQEIERITHENYGSTRFYAYIAKAKKILEKRGKMIKSIGRGDYQVLYPGDYSSAYAREIRLAKGRIKRGGKIIKGAPVNDMTAEERQMLNNISDFHTRLNAQISGNFVEVKRLVGKTHPLAADSSR